VQYKKTVVFNAQIFTKFSLAQYLRIASVTDFIQIGSAADMCRVFLTPLVNVWFSLHTF